MKKHKDKTAEKKDKTQKDETTNKEKNKQRDRQIEERFYDRCCCSDQGHL